VRLGTRLVITLVVPLVALMALFGYLDQRISAQHLHVELSREGRAVVRTSQLALEDYLRDRQLDDLHELADQISNFERILGIRIFGADGWLIYQSRSLNVHPFNEAHALDQVLGGVRRSETHRSLGAQPVISFLVPLSSPRGDIVGALQVLQLESYVDEDARAARESVALVTLAMILATTGIVLLVMRVGVSRPVEDLVRRFRDIRSNEVPARIHVRRHDELGRLALEFNGMCDRLQTSQRELAAEQEERRRMEDRMRNAERLASLGRLAAGLAHEVGTPLNVIRGRAETLLRKTADSEVAHRNLRIIVAQIDRIARIVRSMLDFARTREPRLTSVDAVAVLRKVLEFLAERLEEAGVRVELQAAASPPRIRADPDQIQQVFLNLASNALDAMPRGGTLTLRVARHDPPAPAEGGPPSPQLEIRFEDTGVGIAPQHLDRVFDPFFTTKEVGRGTGLGLSVSYGIVREHGGSIELASDPGRGTRLSVFLPIVPPARGASAGATDGTATAADAARAPGTAGSGRPSTGALP
jgi:two-component system, NtrC family, sensor histidine kinase HydH